MYQQIKDDSGITRTDAIRRVSDGACIPFDTKNSDYQQYQIWIGQGNTPLPA